MTPYDPHHWRTDRCEDHRRCPRTGKLIEIEPRTPRPWMLWLLPITGLLALAWFLIRVVPKPSRAMYPCQRAAMPLASGFVAWLLGIGAWAAALRKAQTSLRSGRCALAAVGISVAAIWVAFSVTTEKRLLADPQPANQPIGVARGIHPGRVVWVHNPEATDWKGPGDGHLWQDEHTNPAAVDEMMSQALRNLTGETSDKAAWDALFRYHNKTRGKGDVGYEPGQKIMVKVNFVGFIRTTDAVNPQTYALQSWVDYMNTSPQMIASLLRQLTETVGVKQSDIAVGDTLAYFANEYYDMLHRQFPHVIYLDCQGGPGRTKTGPSSVPLYWSCNPEGCARDYVPQAYAEADYLINLANLKAHPSAGVTLCAKNHYGSLIRLPYERGYYDMHTSFQRTTGRYRNLVDLMSHSELGGKTVLYLIDGLYGGIHYVEHEPRRFESAPFNNDWTSSLFASQDPVAIDSVGLDFLQAEANVQKYSCMPGTDDYLHEAALIDNPPSGTFYDPDHAGNVVRPASLGVHEHWNNAQEKKYSRNLGRTEGIELVAVMKKADQAKTSGVTAPGAKVKLLADGFQFTEGPAADREGNVFFTDQPNDRICKWSVDGKLTDFMKPCGRSNGLFFDKDGNLWACADMDNELWMIDPQGHVTIFVRRFDDKLLNGPNDLWIAPDGGIYFTDPLYKRPYWKRNPAMQQDGQHVYYVTPDRKSIVRVANDLVQPNGIIGTPDGKLLYVADIGDRKTYRYVINTDGSLSDKKLFCSMGSDGMTIDTEGNVYLTGRGVTVFNPDGEKIEQIDVNKGWTANVCFGGPDRRTLFITASDSLFSIEMRVTGAY
ncbi:MAG TPA: SMP-30/gluconolactonase/LRE family protein [Sedimentisphaerales bacterium]|nr:SMP-30/gluconolactonase/LRE family protein [Sedimentisphaerales bacterium]HRV46160.1 SMP-30/gluconolactonase/LRE family protein [Sedimentisphaerales bacterium]